MSIGRAAPWLEVIFGMVALVAVLAPPPANAATGDPWDGNWHYTLSPYAWLPGISAAMRFNTPDATLSNRSTGNLWDNLSGAFELEATARKGRWGMYGDLDWVDFSDMQGRSAVIGRHGPAIDIGTSWDLRGTLVNFAGTYNLAHGRAGFVDLFFGVRYVRVKGSIDWNLSATSSHGNLDIANSGHGSRSINVVNPVLGLRGRWQPFDGKFFVPYHADYGNNGSTSSIEASLGVGYAFHWGDAALSWREVRLEQHDSDALLKTLTLRGPNLQLTWHF